MIFDRFWQDSVWRHTGGCCSCGSKVCFGKYHVLTTLPSCFFTFIILNVPSKPLIVSGRLNHSSYSLSLCKALWQSSALAQWLQSSSTAGHVCWRFFRLDEHLSATSLDHRTLRILIHLLFWLNRTSWNSWRNNSLCHNSSTGGTHTCLIWSSVMPRCSQQKTSLLWK